MSTYHWDEPRPPAKWQRQEDTHQRCQRKLQQARAKLNSGLYLGKNLVTELAVCIALAELFNHMTIQGATGVGKSYLMEGILKSLILLGYGVCVITPHPDLYERLLAFCAYVNQIRPALKLNRRVIPFNIAETRNIIGFNPIARNARFITYQVVAMMEAIRKCWGQDNFFNTPRMARWMFNTSYALINSQTTFLQAYHMINPVPSLHRKAIIGRITNPRILSEWQFFNQLKPREQEERTESSFNRLKPFLEEPIRSILGQYERPLDFPSVLNDRKILLVNLANQGAIGDDERHLLGTFLVNELLTAAFARPTGARTPFFCCIDEFQHFVTKDICAVLDGGRKFGLHLILGHQHLNQLKLKDPEVYYSALTNARVKVVMGGMDDEDLEILAKELFTGELDPNEVKDEFWQTKFRPVETTRIINAYSTSESESESAGESSGEITHESLARGAVYIPNSGLWSAGAASVSEVVGSGSARSSGWQRSSGKSRGWSEGSTEVPFYQFHEFRELSSRTFRSLEEQLYIKKAQLKRQSRQHAAILVPDTKVQLVKTGTIKELPKDFTDRDVEEFKQEAMEHAGCFKSPEEAEREISTLEERLLLEANPPIEVQSRKESPPKPKRAAKKQTPPTEPDVITEIQTSLRKQ